MEEKGIRGLKFTIKGGEGSGWFAPPEGTHGAGRQEGILSEEELSEKLWAKEPLPKETLALLERKAMGGLWYNYGGRSSAAGFVQINNWQDQRYYLNQRFGDSRNRKSQIALGYLDMRGVLKNGSYSQVAGALAAILNKEPAELS